MKSNLHPKYEPLHVKCTNCGNEFDTRSTLCKPELKLDVCIKCHPFSTKEQRSAKAGQVERFNKRFGISDSKDASKEG